MRVGSLFAGVGGFDIAAERAGMNVLWQSEYDNAASRVLEHHWPGLNLGDIHDIRMESEQRRSGGSDLRTDDGADGSRTLTEFSPILRNTDNGEGHEQSETGAPAVDVLCGGFPCQDYSVAGNREGLAGDRGALWWEYHRLIEQGRPTWVVAENVPGLLSSRGGQDFATIIDSLTELGYGVVWGVLDAQYFGVAQRRRRVFIVAHSSGQPRPEILALEQGVFGHPEPSRQTRQDATEDVAFSSSAELIGRNPTVRRLTPLECERLQGFPDGWTDIEGNPDSQRYKQMGNAVAVPVVQWIMERIANGQ